MSFYKLSALIDAMPMRKQEIKKNRKAESRRAGESLVLLVSVGSYCSRTHIPLSRSD